MAVFCTTYRRIDGTVWSGPYIRADSREAATGIAASLILADQFYDHEHGVTVDGALVETVPADDGAGGEGRMKQQCPRCKEWCAHGFCGYCERVL
jgi:hypothetical protein